MRILRRNLNCLDELEAKLIKKLDPTLVSCCDLMLVGFLSALVQNMYMDTCFLAGGIARKCWRLVLHCSERLPYNN